MSNQNSMVNTKPKLKNMPKRKNTLNKRYKNAFWGYLMLFPTLIGLIIFYVYPFFQTLFYSFTDMGAFGKHTWIGLENYKTMINDANLWLALRNKIHT